MAKQWVALMMLLATLPSWSESPRNQEPIRIITNDWSSQIVLAHIAGGVFNSLGYNVEYSESSTAEQWGALALGLDHVQVEVWQGTMSDMFNRMLAARRIVDAGSHAAVTREDWWYPSYVEEACPGLPDWRALKRCSAIFSATGSGPGIYHAGPWEKPEAARIRALAMDFVVESVTGADDLWGALEDAAHERRPIVLFNWTPNWVEARFEGKFVEFPPYDPACETDPEWGVNPKYLYDCGNPGSGWLKKAAWAGMPDKWECAYRSLQLMSVDNQTLAQLAAWVDVDQLSYSDAAEQWLLDNSSIWASWIPDDCMAHHHAVH